MKRAMKKFSFVLFALALAFCLGCSIEPTQHTHTFSTEWSYDDSFHWHSSTCGHDVVSDKKTHDYSTWITTKDVTPTEAGSRSRYCLTCGFEQTEEIPERGEYKVGDIGPAGGYIFYDCDADNESGNADGLTSTQVGWRYLEAAPADLKVVDGVPTVDSSSSGYSSAYSSYLFGYYRTTDSGSNLYVNGTTTYNASDCSGTAIGTGKKNTVLLVRAMGSSAYSSSSGSDKTSEYAAKLCDDLVYNGFDDWFLPSKDELNLMYANLKKAGLGGFADNDYWSSSEYDYFVGYAWEQDFDNGDQYYHGSSYYHRVRAVRAF